MSKYTKKNKKIVKNDKSFENDFEKLYLKKHSAIMDGYKNWEVIEL